MMKYQSYETLLQDSCILIVMLTNKINCHLSSVRLLSICNIALVRLGGNQTNFYTGTIPGQWVYMYRKLPIAIFCSVSSSHMELLCLKTPFSLPCSMNSLVNCSQSCLSLAIQVTITHTASTLTARSQATLLPKRGTCSRAICVQPASLPTRARTGVCWGIIHLVSKD